MPVSVHPALTLAVALLPAALLAGCADAGGKDPAGDAGDLGGPGGDGGQAGAAGSLALPTWAVGDAWTYAMRLDGSAVDDTTYVVTSDGGSDWVVETDSAERAFSNERDDVSRLGPQRKSDLAGSQGDERVEYFRWPLEVGRTWQARWDHADVAVEVMEVADGVAHLEARAPNGTLVYRYTYDAEARWFGSIQHLYPDGREMVGLDLVASVHNWTGTLVHWSLQTVVADAGNDPMQPPQAAGPFEVPAGTTDIWAEYHFTCGGNGGYSVAVEPLNPGLAGQQGMYDGGPCTQVDWEGAIVPGPHPGSWAMAVSAGGQTIDYDYAILLRTRADVPFPA